MSFVFFYTIVVNTHIQEEQDVANWRRVKKKVILGNRDGIYTVGPYVE